MFQIGDNIVYPMHGAGTIEAIEEKQFLEEKQQYYVHNTVVFPLRIVFLLWLQLYLLRALDKQCYRQFETYHPPPYIGT